MRKFRIRYGNHNFVGSYPEIMKWANEPCYNEFQRLRQAAAKRLMMQFNPAEFEIL